MTDQSHGHQGGGTVDYGGSSIGYYGHFNSSMHNSTTSAAPTLVAEAGSPPIGSFVNGGLGNVGMSMGYHAQPMYHAPGNPMMSPSNPLVGADYSQHQLASMTVPKTPQSPALSTPPLAANRSLSQSYSHGLPPTMPAGTSLPSNGLLARPQPSSVPHGATVATAHPSNTGPLPAHLLSGHTLSMVSMNTAVGSFGSAAQGEGDPLLAQYKSASELERHGSGRFTLDTVRGHVLAFAMDPDGSRALQRLISEACGLPNSLAKKGGLETITHSKTQKVVIPSAALDSLHRLFVELEEPLLEVISNTYGHFTVQKLIETQSVDIILRTIRRCRDNFFLLAQDNFGSRIVQSLVESILLEEHKELLVPHVAALIEEMGEGDNVYNLIRDQNGNHVLQKCLLLATQHCAIIPKGIAGHFIDLATHVYGSRVIQCVYEQLKNPAGGQEYQVAALQLMILAKQHASDLVMTQFGNFVVSHALINSPEATADASRGTYAFATGLAIPPNEIRKSIVDTLLPNLLTLAGNKFASNVAQRLFVYADEQQKGQILWILTQQPSGGSAPARGTGGSSAATNSNSTNVATAAAAAGLPPPPPVVTMMSDQFANYVIQAVLEHVSSTQKYELCERIKPYVGVISASQCGRHILCKYTPSIAPPAALAASNANGKVKAAGGRGSGGMTGRGRGGASTSAVFGKKPTQSESSTTPFVTRPSYSNHPSSSANTNGFAQSIDAYNSLVGSSEGMSSPFMFGTFGYPAPSPYITSTPEGYNIPPPMQTTPWSTYMHQPAPHHPRFQSHPQQHHQPPPPFYIPQSSTTIYHAPQGQQHGYPPFSSAASTLSSGQTVPAGRASADTTATSSSGAIPTQSSNTASATSNSFGLVGAPAYPSFLTTGANNNHECFNFSSSSGRMDLYFNVKGRPSSIPTPL